MQREIDSIMNEFLCDLQNSSRLSWTIDRRVIINKHLKNTINIFNFEVYFYNEFYFDFMPVITIKYDEEGNYNYFAYFKLDIKSKDNTDNMTAQLRMSINDKESFILAMYCSINAYDLIYDEDDEDRSCLRTLFLKYIERYDEEYEDDENE